MRCCRLCPWVWQLHNEVHNGLWEVRKLLERNEDKEGKAQAKEVHVKQNQSLSDSSGRQKAGGEEAIHLLSYSSKRKSQMFSPGGWHCSAGCPTLSLYSLSPGDDWTAAQVHATYRSKFNKPLSVSAQKPHCLWTSLQHSKLPTYWNHSIWMNQPVLRGSIMR